MNEERNFRELKKEFESTFGELIPGILHNFANPLNGILGRSGLLEERAKKNFELITNSGCKIDGEILESCKKIICDAGLIAEEADRSFGLFNDVAEKIGMLNDTGLQRINLSELIEAEMAFLQFYPDFKHNIKKKLTLDREIPEVSGIKADYSISLSAIIRHSMNSMKDSEVKELVVSTGHDDSHVCVKIEDTGEPVAGRTEILENLSSAGRFLYDPDGEKGLFHALFLMKKYGALFQTAHESGFNVVSIRIPY
ncbi:MAG: HAMP domain-containing histidine kinase [Deltaproteobacteria bacterium]|nr:HAMP domain-containing histidine kinase [Deltaproteobacteria bacterium]